MKLIITESQYKRVLNEGRITQAWYLFDMLKAQLNLDDLSKNVYSVDKVLSRYKKIDTRAYALGETIEKTIWQHGSVPREIMSAFSDCSKHEVEEDYQNCKERARQLFYTNFDDIMEEKYPLAFHLHDDFNMSYKRAFKVLAIVSDMFSGVDNLKNDAIRVYKFFGEEYLGDEREYLAKVFNSKNGRQIVNYIQKKMNIPFALWEMLEEIKNIRNDSELLRRLREVEQKYGLPKTFIARLSNLYN